jgi:hypothetical protein
MNAVGEREHCFWCGCGFSPRHTGGSAQRFCSPACRHALDLAGRRWVADALAEGRLTVRDLKASSTACAPVTSANEGARGHGPQTGVRMTDSGLNSPPVGTRAAARFDGGAAGVAERTDGT